ncbi:lysozyme 1B-like isoform X3 [Centruroides vittatus]|uniref:lysozyme 1B-like isoform X3 n=1 Tax=Centruroides vittatus TaxID=120091 RepID=UPI00350F3956
MRFQGLALQLTILSFFVCTGWGRVYERCELGRELYERFKFPKQDLSRWLCIAYWESNYDTSAIYQSYDNAVGHGLFQVSDKYWCQPSNGRYSTNGCNMTCDALEDDDISDDIQCALSIYRRFGFNGWMSNKAKCEADTNDYFSDCDISSRKGLLLTAHPKGITIHFPHPFLSIFKKLKPSVSGYVRIKPFFAITKGVGLDKSIGLGKGIGLGKATPQ